MIEMYDLNTNKDIQSNNIDIVSWVKPYKNVRSIIYISIHYPKILPVKGKT
jgi:hypothetical protein